MLCKLAVRRLLLACSGRSNTVERAPRLGLAQTPKRSNQKVNPTHRFSQGALTLEPEIELWEEVFKGESGGRVEDGLFNLSYKRRDIFDILQLFWGGCFAFLSPLSLRKLLLCQSAARLALVFGTSRRGR